MIRRRAGSEFWLITQQAHADAAAVLACHLGGDRDGLYERSSDPARFRRAVLLHDVGWKPVDDAPPLNDEGLPLDVFDVKPFELSAEVWLNCVRGAMKADPYAGLLTSLHFSDLSPKPRDRAEQFAMLQYQQEQAELQERLRRTLGLSRDDPDFATENGLAVDSTDPREHAITADFWRLRACDMLSLCACRADLPTERIGPLRRRDAGPSLPIGVVRESWDETAETAGDLVIHPWPFDIEAVRLEIEFRAVPARTFASTDDLRGALQSAEPAMLKVRVRPRPRA